MVVDNSENIERYDAGSGQPKKAVLRAHDVIPYGEARNEDKIIIPKFDLTRDIMAQHRKTTAEKRQGPGEKPAAANQATSAERKNYRVERLRPERTEQDKVLAEIVSRDIARLCDAKCSA